MHARKHLLVLLGTYDFCLYFQSFSNGYLWIPFLNIFPGEFIPKVKNTFKSKKSTRAQALLSAFRLFNNFKKVPNCLIVLLCAVFYTFHVQGVFENHPSFS